MSKINMYHHAHVVTVLARKGKPQRIAIKATCNDSGQRKVLVAFIEQRPKGRIIVKYQKKHDEALTDAIYVKLKQRYGVKTRNSVSFIPVSERPYGS